MCDLFGKCSHNTTFCLFNPKLKIKMKKLNKTLNVVNHLTCYHCHTLMHDFIRVIMQLQAQPSEKKKKKHPKNSQPTCSDNGEMIQDAQQ